MAVAKGALSADPEFSDRDGLVPAREDCVALAVSWEMSMSRFRQKGTKKNGAKKELSRQDLSNHQE
ncbi:hypothetical protein GCM10009038_02710 [Salinicola rhizosphaerae]|uniref:Uncharacterized protein n=1 Tax=Salinicola rhizosphaerae TaxID=1443141 RepID=A0ABQ3DP36_9GAMM|nr:hypothetical protein GCM10009038_02710 [Salinicola rhizosphaerae]